MSFSLSRWYMVIRRASVWHSILFKNLLNQVEGLSNLVEDLRTLSF